MCFDGLFVLGEWVGDVEFVGVEFVVGVFGDVVDGFDLFVV